MTLNWNDTADDWTLTKALRPLVQTSLWHDGQRWWTRDDHGTWTSPRAHTAATFKHLTSAAEQLPDTPYWARSKQRLRTSSHLYRVASQLAIECLMNNWPKPGDLAS